MKISFEPGAVNHSGLSCLHTDPIVLDLLRVGGMVKIKIGAVAAAVIHTGHLAMAVIDSSSQDENNEPS